MIYRHNNPNTGAECNMIVEEPGFDRTFYGRDRHNKLLTIAWNPGPASTVTIDGVNYVFPAQSLLCLMVNESFRFEDTAAIIAWQFNREFYCIVDHDKEVSCAGFLFYSSAQRLFIALDDTGERKMRILSEVFREEFETEDKIQGEMLQALLKRLIIMATRLARLQYTDQQTLTDDKLDTIRKYNMLVEHHYRNEHQVAFYASQLHKSPKTLSNLFALYNHSSPLAVIQERIQLEARRLLTYTDKSAKEIAYELGFEDATHFSKFFKKGAGQSPTDFRKGSISPAQLPANLQ